MRNFRNLALSTLIYLFFLSSCSEDKHKINPVIGKKENSDNTLIENITGDMPYLDPQQGGNGPANRVIGDLFEGLVEYNQKSEIVPAGAESWEVSGDGLTYIFHLHKDAKWSNGEPLTAEDYIYSYQRAVTPKTIVRYYSNFFDPILNSKEIQAGNKRPNSLGVYAKDPYTLEIKLEKPNPIFLHTLTLPVFLPVNKNAIKKHGISWADTPESIVSNGAYSLTEWIHNGYAQATKNKYYWNNDNVNIEKVRYLMIDDTTSDMQNYSAGKLGITFHDLPPNSQDWYKTKFPKQYKNYLVSSQAYYAFNLRKDKFKNINVRKALSMVIDRDGLTKGVLQHGQQPSYLVVPENTDNSYKDLWKKIPNYKWVKEPMNKRITTAKSLIKQAGYSQDNPLNIEISFFNGDENRNIALVTQAIWNNVFEGAVITTIINQDTKVFLEDLSNGNFDIAYSTWLADFNAPSTYTEMYTCSSDNNHFGFCNKEVDDLYNKSSQTAKEEQYYKLQEELIIKETQNYITIPLFTMPYARLVQSYIKGFNPEHNLMGRHKTKQLTINYD